jgi:hypothetical protein
MATSTSIATESTRTASIQNASDYTNGIGAHIAGDWQQHNQTNISYTEAWRIQAASSPGDEAHALHYVPNTALLRMLVTIGSTDYAIIVPAIASGAFTGNGTYAGSPTATAPVFTLQPASGSYTQGARVVLTVAVDGTPPVLLAWRKNGVSLGETGTSLYINNFTYLEVGDYTCIATNALGQSVSNTAILALKTSTGEPVPTRPF